MVNEETGALPLELPDRIGPYSLTGFLRETRDTWVCTVADDNPLGPSLMLHAMKPGRVNGQAAADRFVRYAAKIGVVQSPCLIVPIDAGHDDATGFTYTITRRLSGPSLAQQFPDRAPLTRQEIEADLGPIIDVVGRLQGQSCAHLEIGADHVWLDEAGRSVLGEARIDWSDPAATQRPNPQQTDAVSLPEERLGTVTELARADVFGLGRLLFEAATGLPLESALPILREAPDPAAIEELRRIIDSDTESRIQFPDSIPIDDGLKTIIQRACQASPYLRFESAHHLRDAFEASKSGIERVRETGGDSRSAPDSASSSEPSASARPTRASENSQWRASAGSSTRRRASIDPQQLRRIGPYDIDRFIDAGGFAWVFEVSDADVGGKRKLALKVLMPDAAEGDEFLRFERESDILVGLKHPNLVHVYRFARDLTTGCYYYAMDFVEGPTLAARLKEGPLTPAEIERIFPGLLDALGLIHREGVVHRDFKPKNIMGVQAPFPVLGDLGIAHLRDAGDQTSRGVAIGTSHYMSPEQAHASEHITPASDVFSAGVTLYEAVTGQRLYQSIEGIDGTNAKAVESYLSEVARRGERIPIQYPPGAHVPKALQKVIAKACRTRPEERYANGDEMKEALDAALQGRRGVPRWALAAAAAAALVAVSLPLIYTRWISQTDAALARTAGRDNAAVQSDARLVRNAVGLLELDEAERAVLASADPSFALGEEESRLGERDLQNENWTSGQNAFQKSTTAYADYCSALSAGLLETAGARSAEAALDRIADLRRGFPVPADKLEADVAPPRIAAAAGACKNAERHADYLTRARTALAAANSEIANRELYPSLAKSAEGAALAAQAESDRYLNTEWEGSRMAGFYAREYSESLDRALAALMPASDWREDGQIEEAIAGFKEAQTWFRRAADAAAGHELAMRLPRLRDEEEIDEFDPFAESTPQAADQSGSAEAEGTTGDRPDRIAKTPLQSLREARCDTAYFDTSNRAVGEIAAFCRRALNVAPPAGGEVVPELIERPAVPETHPTESPESGPGAPDR